MIATVKDIWLSQGRVKISFLGVFPSGNNFKSNALKCANKSCSDAKAEDTELHVTVCSCIFSHH